MGKGFVVVVVVVVGYSVAVCSAIPGRVYFIVWMNLCIFILAS